MPTMPKILFTEEAWRRLQALVEISDVECSMLGEVETKDNTLMVTKIYIPQQTRSAAFTEITHDGIFNLLTQKGIDPSKIKAWFHSHVNMGVSPSARDEQQIKDLMSDAEWFIRGIWNKKGEYSLSIHWMGCEIAAVPMIAWTTSVDKEALKAELDAQTVTTVVKTYYPKQYGGYGVVSGDDEDPFDSDWKYTSNGRYNTRTHKFEAWGNKKKVEVPTMSYIKFSKNNDNITYDIYKKWSELGDSALSYDDWFDKKLDEAQTCIAIDTESQKEWLAEYVLYLSNLAICKTASQPKNSKRANK